MAGTWPGGLPPAAVDIVTAAGLSGQQLLVDGGGWLTGLVAAETGGMTPATVRLWAGSSSSGALLCTVQVPAGTTATLTPGLPGIPVTGPLWADVTAGTLDLSVTIAKVTAA